VTQFVISLLRALLQILYNGSDDHRQTRISRHCSCPPPSADPNYFLTMVFFGVSGDFVPQVPYWGFAPGLTGDLSLRPSSPFTHSKYATDHRSSSGSHMVASLWKTAVPDCVECPAEIQCQEMHIREIVSTEASVWSKVIISAAVVEPVGRKANWSVRLR